ncbi:fibroin heavy chain isoform X3 [Gouania willdenowi]|uniref:fibroin heavy chain isoform X3 n=1 Tax=Gouania willdenowi TaxID=441366 RepID=UPI0010562796|nr:fibroin heavy chain-like isoform X3 [Gouania willdenowi]
MLVRAVLQTSLLLWLAQQTLQGAVAGVQPQSVSWGQGLPARGLGVGVKPGDVSALGAVANRFESKAMKAGLGRYGGAQLGLGGYRTLGLGGRAGMRHGGYGVQGVYGAGLGTGMGLGTGLTNGLGLGLGQGGKRVYGTGLGTVPGYGALGAIGYPGLRPGHSQYPSGQGSKQPKTAGLGPAETDNLSQTVPDLRRERIRAGVPTIRKPNKGLGPEIQGLLRPNVPESNYQRERKSINFLNRGESTTPLNVHTTHRRESHESTALKIKGFTPAAESAGRQPSVNQEPIRRTTSASSQTPIIRNNDRFPLINLRPPNCGPSVHGSDRSELLRQKLVGSQSSVPQLNVGVVSQQNAHRDQQLLPQDVRSNMFSTQKSRGFSSTVIDRHGREGPLSKDAEGPGTRRTFTLEQHPHESISLPRSGNPEPLIPGITSIAGLEVQPSTTEGWDVKEFSQSVHDVKKLKTSPGQDGTNAKGTSYGGGVGNYLGTGLGAGGYGAALGQGGYLGGAAGKLAAGTAVGYGDGMTGYLGPMAGYGNGYGDAYGAGLGYPADLAVGLENKAGKSEGLGTGGLVGPLQGAYGGAAQVPFANTPVLPVGLEGDGGYPYNTQQLSLTAEAAKSASKYEAGPGFRAQQAAGLLGPNQDVLGEQTGKYGGVNAALGNGYKA